MVIQRGRRKVRPQRGGGPRHFTPAAGREIPPQNEKYRQPASSDEGDSGSDREESLSESGGAVGTSDEESATLQLASTKLQSSASEPEDSEEEMHKPPVADKSQNPSCAKPSTGHGSRPQQPRELTRREREAIEKERARQYYLQKKQEEDAARLAIVRKQREAEAARQEATRREKEAARLQRR